MLTEKVLGIDWKEYFPLLIDKDETVELTSLDEVVEFHRNHHDVIYEKNPSSTNFLNQDYTPNKHRYYKEAADCFAFRKNGKTVGVYIGNLVDWSTYYIRYCAILPEFQGGGRFNRFLLYTFDILRKHGCERAEGDVSPSNTASIHLFNKLNFNITGYISSERYGSLMKYTKFLSQKHEEFFVHHFCAGVTHQLKTKSPQVPQLQLSDLIGKEAI